MSSDDSDAETPAIENVDENAADATDAVSEQPNECPTETDSEADPLNVLPHVGSMEEPCYLPQKTDKRRERKILADEPLPEPKTDTERVDFSALANMTGFRPDVHRLNQNRYSVREWRERNLATQTLVNDAIENARNTAYVYKRTLERTDDYLKQARDDTTQKLKHRIHEMHTWRAFIQTAMNAMIKEIELMEQMEERLLSVKMLFALPASISQECIDVRNRRDTSEMVRDEVEDELRKELVIVGDARELLQLTLNEVRQQLLEDRQIRNFLEYSWNDKNCAIDIDCKNMLLNEHTRMVFCLGAAKNPPGQISPESWEEDCKEIIRKAENARMQSLEVRQTAHNRIITVAADVRNQADIVERALINHINCMKANIRRFELDFDTLLNLIRDAELHIEDLRRKLRSMDQTTKLVQNRLNNRTFRENMENCRDLVHVKLINEATIVHTSGTVMIEQLRAAEKCKEQLILARERLQTELNHKYHAIFIDRDRCMQMRTLFPGFNALTIGK